MRGLSWRFGAAVLALIALSSAAVAQDRTLQIIVLDPDGKPVQGATVRRDAAGAVPMTTDNVGIALLLIPAQQSSDLTLRVSAPKRVPRVVRMGGPNGGPNLPASYPVRLEPGTTIGGRVLTPQQKPVGGAEVQLAIRYPPALVLNEDGIHNAPDVEKVRVNTDVEGRWSYDGAPAAMTGVLLAVMHPKFVGPGTGGLVSLTPLQLKQNATIEMQPAIALRGRVLGPDGNPVGGATVTRLKDGMPGVKVQTDGRGEFLLPRMPVGVIDLFAHAPGFAPVIEQVTTKDDDTRAEMKLPEGKVVTGRVVDSTGNGVPDANVSAQSVGPRRVDNWAQLRTDAEGNFRLDGAPDAPVKFLVTAAGFEWLRDQQAVPGDVPAVFRMSRSLMARLKVSDWHTGEPVTAFTLTPGRTFGERTNWADPTSYSSPNGALDYRITFERYDLRIDAHGYEPQMIKLAGEGVVPFPVRMKRAAPIAGVVKAPDGKPLANAQVVLVRKSFGPTVKNGYLDQRQQRQTVTTTDERGAYTFQREIEPYHVLVLDDRGFAHVGPEQAKEITVVPWGRIKGVIKIGDKPAPGGTTALYETHHERPADGPPIWFAYHVEVGKDGRFVFDRAIPGPGVVGRFVELGHGQHAGTQGVPIQVTPGGTTTVTIGGLGRPVVGTVKLPDGMDVRHVSISIRPPRPKLDSPPEYEGWTKEQQDRWYAEWKLTPAGKTYAAALDVYLKTLFRFPVDASGRFRADDVPAGKYEIFLMPNARIDGKTPKEVTVPVEVPEMAGGRSDEPLDVGVVEWTP